MEPLFSVIIPNWNGRQLLGPCLASIAVQTFRAFEVILVDNGSTDGSVAFVRNDYPWVSICELGENLGFAAGVNAGIRLARGNYIVLLNNDTETDSKWLEKLAESIGDCPDIWLFASKLLNFYDRDLVDSAGDAFDLFLGPYKIGENARSSDFGRRTFIFGPCGGGGCYRRELFDRIGLFDEDFFAYFEDVDLSFRANWCGFRSLLVPDAVIYHKVAATSGDNAINRDRFDIMRRRNYILMLVKNYPATFLLRYLWFILIAHTVNFLQNLLRGRVRVAFQTQYEIAVGLPGMVRKRRAIMSGRCIANRELKSRCSSKYEGVGGFLKKKLKLGAAGP
jgi:GT2 family glycosyltransferase